MTEIMTNNEIDRRVAEAMGAEEWAEPYETGQPRWYFPTFGTSTFCPTSDPGDAREMVRWAAHERSWSVEVHTFPMGASATVFRVHPGGIDVEIGWSRRWWEEAGPTADLIATCEAFLSACAKEETP